MAAIVLAAGCATRMGSQKLLLELGGRPLVQRAVDAALSSHATKTIVVVGHEAERVRDDLAGRAVTFAVNPDYAAGMSTSLQSRRAGGRGLRCRHLPAWRPAICQLRAARPVDRPLRQTRASVVRPAVGGRPANPVLLSAALFPELLEQRGDVGGREVVERHRDEVCLVPVDDPRVVADIDSIEDYEAARGNT